MGGFITAVWTYIRNRKLECATSSDTTIPRLRIAARSDDAGRARIVTALRVVMFPTSEYRTSLMDVLWLVQWHVTAGSPWDHLMLRIRRISASLSTGRSPSSPIPPTSLSLHWASCRDSVGQLRSCDFELDMHVSRSLHNDL